ncbi:MAG: hypothetical protein JO168_18545 [Solirubrobacterales bacterium]|nr:hypothetical protein [Solirubrobacterales bacterium]MBV9715784.1 hypothetical protein [Solirubrobacterales bacterium]
MSGEREDWEYADGPTVGPDVPVTSEPRPEEQPGVPAPSLEEAGEAGREETGDGTETPRNSEARGGDGDPGG